MMPTNIGPSIMGTLVSRQIAVLHLGDVTVSTVRLPYGHIPFQTMIFGGKYDEYQRRYMTREEALAGHARAVELAKGEREPDPTEWRTPDEPEMDPDDEDDED